MWTQRSSPSPPPPSADPTDHRRLPSSEPQARLLSQCICDWTPSRAGAGTAGNGLQTELCSRQTRGASPGKVMGARTRRGGAPLPSTSLPPILPDAPASEPPSCPRPSPPRWAKQLRYAELETEAWRREGACPGSQNKWSLESGTPPPGPELPGDPPSRLSHTLSPTCSTPGRSSLEAPKSALSLALDLLRLSKEAGHPASPSCAP